MRVFNRLSVIILILLSMAFFQNCGGSLEEGDSDSLLASVETACGKSGYEQLLKSYFRPKCGGCHGDNGFVSPRFAGVDSLNSYYEGKSIPREKMLESVLDNPFCGESCNLVETDLTFQQIEHWLANPDKCN